MYWSRLFFFQAEDGIRDLVRSRGLGDVYKRQSLYGLEQGLSWRGIDPEPVTRRRTAADAGLGTGPVSYTHLTLPTSDLV